MKHFTLAALAAAALLCGTTACNEASNSSAGAGVTLKDQLDRSLAKATTFTDSLTAVDGTFIGGFFNSQLSAPNLPQKLNKTEFIRGMRDALQCDTADMSYVYGFNSGTTALQTFMQLSKTESVNRDEFINAIIAALRVDSVSQEEVMEIRNEFDRYERLVAERAEQKAKDEAMNSEAGQANIKAAEEFVATLSGATDFSEVAPGIYQRIITPGTGERLTSADRVNVTYTLTHLDGTEINSVTNPRPMYVGSPSFPLLRAVLPQMKLGETAEFYLPYDRAFGELGNEAAGVGPCESLLVKVTTEPYEG